MKIIRKILKYLCITLLLLLIIGLLFPTWTPKIKGDNSISTMKQIKINGSMHEIMIRGQNIQNPVIIFVHGGPGCSEIPYVTKYQALLEKDFTIVHYDQRGSGKSYHFFEDYQNLSSELLVDDLLVLTDYVTELFHKEKVILIGHSFGTYIGLQAAAKSPEKYLAYIGIGQMADTRASELDSLEYCIEQAEDAGNRSDVDALKALRGDIEQGKILTPRNYVRKYGGASRLIDDNKDYLTGFLFQPEYNLLDVIRFNRGVAISQDILLRESIENPLTDLLTELDTPCYFVMGQYDYMTSTKAAERYYHSINAPYKEFIVFNDSAHYPQFEEKEKFAAWMSDNFSDK